MSKRFIDVSCTSMAHGDDESAVMLLITGLPNARAASAVSDLLMDVYMDMQTAIRDLINLETQAGEKRQGNQK